jgi:hypothetical protein
MNIYERVNEVRKRVGYAQKDKAVEGYKAVTHDAVTALLRNHLIDLGIVIVPRVLSSSVVPAGETSKGTPIIRYEARYQIEFANVEAPEDRIEVVVDAHANDYGDKAPGKALSYATKSAMLKLFSIETGESDESRVDAYVPPEERVAITEEQAVELDALVSEVVKDRAKFMVWVAKAAGVDDLRLLPAKKLDLVRKQLESMRPKK